MTEPRKAAITPKQAERLRATADRIQALQEQYHAMLSVLWPYDGPAEVRLVDGEDGPELAELTPQSEPE